MATTLYDSLNRSDKMLRTSGYVPKSDYSPVAALLQVKQQEDAKLKAQLSGYKPDFSPLQKLLDKYNALPNAKAAMEGYLNKGIEKFNAGLKKYGSWYNFSNKPEFNEAMSYMNIPSERLIDADMQFNAWESAESQYSKDGRLNNIDYETFMNGMTGPSGKLVVDRLTVDKMPDGKIRPLTIGESMKIAKYSPLIAENPNYNFSHNTTSFDEAREKASKTITSGIGVDSFGYITGINVQEITDPLSKAVYHEYSRMKKESGGNKVKMTAIMENILSGTGVSEYFGDDIKAGMLQGYVASPYYNSLFDSKTAKGKKLLQAKTSDEQKEIIMEGYNDFMRKQAYDIAHNFISQKYDESASNIGMPKSKSGTEDDLAGMNYFDAGMNWHKEISRDVPYRVPSGDYIKAPGKDLSLSLPEFGQMYIDGRMVTDFVKEMNGNNLYAENGIQIEIPLNYNLKGIVEGTSIVYDAAPTFSKDGTPTGIDRKQAQTYMVVNEETAKALKVYNVNRKEMVSLWDNYNLGDDDERQIPGDIHSYRKAMSSLAQEGSGSSSVAAKRASDNLMKFKEPGIVPFSGDDELYRIPIRIDISDMRPMNISTDKYKYNPATSGNAGAKNAQSDIVNNPLYKPFYELGK